MALQVFDDFEDNDLSEWTVHNGNLTTDTTSYNGSYSAYIDVSESADIDFGHRLISSGGKQIEKFVFWYRETSSSTGGGLRLVDSSGNNVLAVGTDNPQPWATDGSSVTRWSPGANYTTWYKIEITFDWANDQYTFDWNDGAISNTLSLNNSTDVETVEFVNANQPHNSGGINDLDGGDGTSTCEMWWDYLRYDPGIYGEVKLETGSGAVTLPVFDTADLGSGVYDVVRVQTSSGVGFVPFTSVNDAKYAYLRIQTQNNGVLAAHDQSALETYLNGWVLDDWADGNLESNRQDWDATAFQGSEPSSSSYQTVTRQPWTRMNNNAIIRSGYLDMDVSGSEVVYRSYDISDIDMNWYWEFELKGNGSQNDDDLNFVLFGQNLDYDGGWWLTPRYGYWIWTQNDGSMALVVADGSGGQSTLIEGPQDLAMDTKHTAKVTRSGGDWELWVNGTSQGTATDTSWDSSYATRYGFTKSNGPGGYVHTIKIW